jgi:hypothetical protein
LTAVFPSKNLSRPQIFTAIQLLKTATFEESGRDGGHMAALVANSWQKISAKSTKKFGCTHITFSWELFNTEFWAIQRQKKIYQLIEQSKSADYLSF